MRGRGDASKIDQLTERIALGITTFSCRDVKLSGILDSRSHSDSVLSWQRLWYSQLGVGCRFRRGSPYMSLQSYQNRHSQAYWANTPSILCLRFPGVKGLHGGRGSYTLVWPSLLLMSTPKLRVMVHGPMYPLCWNWWRFYGWLPHEPWWLFFTPTPFELSAVSSFAAQGSFLSNNEHSNIPT